MNGRDMQEDKEQLEAYALGALDANEVAETEAFIRNDSAAQQELAELRNAVAMLPYAADSDAPPEHVKRRLMSKIAAEQQAAAAPRPERRLERRPGRVWAPMAAIAAVLLLALSLSLGGMVFSLQNTVDDLRQSNAVLRDDVSALQRDLQTLAGAQRQTEEQLATSQEQVSRLTKEVTSSQRALEMLNAQLTNDQRLLTFISAPGVATRQLVAVDDRNRASGEMYMYPGDDQAVVLFRDLPQLEPGRVYQFWLANGNDQVPAGTIKADEDGLARLQVTAPREVNAFNQVMLTVEPEGGSLLPSDDVVLEGFL